MSSGSTSPVRAGQYKEAHSYHTSSQSTPPSSPPSVHNMSEKDFEPVSKAMLAEEKKMHARRKAEEQAETRKRALEMSGSDADQQNKEYARLMHLVNQSKVYAFLMQQKIENQQGVRKKHSNAEQKKTERDAEAEGVTDSSPRKVTRALATRVGKRDDIGDAQRSATKVKKLPTRGRSKKGTENGSITKFLKKDNRKAHSGDLTFAEDVAEAADGFETKATDLATREPYSAHQPAEVTGGTMREYQLAGLDWLVSLYENGLNGILADEMGLGKTVQTISLLAHLRSKGTMGPFLVVAPLSTLSNWVDEFGKWTPSIPTLLYHGSPTERAEFRRTRLSVKSLKEFPVVCTSYEICMNDRKFLSQFSWKFVIIDEGHRLKNRNCRLIKELKQYRSANRVLITGTPLQNNLSELWSLLNFLMPDVFDTFDNFKTFFDFSAMLDSDGSKKAMRQERESNLVSDLHEILKPFLLRRVKTDVATDLPKKREYILWAPLTPLQKELYTQILQGNGRAFLEQQVIDRIEDETPLSSRSAGLKRKAGSDNSGLNTPSTKSAKSSRASTPGTTLRPRRIHKSGKYKELSDAEYFEKIAAVSESEEEEEMDPELTRHLKSLELAKKEIANKKLQNPIMQLRLACNSPHNFYWPWENDHLPDDTLVTSSGKMIILERLVPYLFAAGHKVLVFSQFKTQLDILEDWAALQHGWKVCRIDGAVKQDDRRQYIQDFNTKPDVRLFLLSTRAGGQGINLAAADTVILFDSDWNPQQDLQAQDRAHRIGQTRPVIVYRLATKGTVEQTLLEKADSKRRLEKLVIQKGKFKSLVNKDGDTEADRADELAKLLAHNDSEGYDPGEGVLSDEDLMLLTDRSEEAYVRAEKGLDVGEKFKTVETKRDSHGVLGEVIH